MKLLFGITMVIGLGFSSMAEEQGKTRVLTDFSIESGPGGWSVEDDRVMGGRSQGSFAVNDEGNGIFSGKVSLENDGGFSSVQYYFEPMDVSDFSRVCMRVKGDGKRYRFLVESEADAWHYYETEFDTGVEWETIEIQFSDFVPVRRGDRLAKPNFPGKTLSQIRLMIANGTAESFQLEVDKIWLK